MRGSVQGTVTDEVVSCLQSAVVVAAAVCKSPVVEPGFEAADTGAETVELDKVLAWEIRAFIMIVCLIC